MSNDVRIFKSIVFHKVKINGARTELFSESDRNDSSISELSEQEIVKWFFSRYEIRNLIIELISGLSSEEVIYELEVKEPLLTIEERQVIGDIDAIIIPKTNPEKAVIIEFKRIKIRTLETKFVKTNKISKVRNKGFSQIKKLRRFDYYKTYLGVIIEDDARNVESANTIVRNSKNSIVDSIYDINLENKLEDKTGLFFIEITQPTGESFESRFNFDITVEKEAVEIKQNNTTTQRINKMIKI